MQTGGLVLDIYDDPSAVGPRVARSAPTEAVKTASALSPEMLLALPDRVFALCVYEGDAPAFRKYACVDQGHTELHLAAFLENRHKLDAEVQAHTAENLKLACAWYGMEVPEELEKVGGVLGALQKANTLAAIPSMAGGVHGEIKRNLSAVRQGEQAHGSTSGGLAAMAAHKLAETSYRGINEASVVKNEPANLKPVIKSAMSPLRRDCAPPTIEKKAASVRTAIPGVPLDSYAEVKIAADRFEAEWSNLPLADRRVYGLQLVKRAAELRIPVGPVALHYGSNKCASEEEWGAAYASRRAMLDADLHADFDKVAACRDELPPVKFASLLEAFDQITGLEYHYGRIPDPYLSAFGKLASVLDPQDEYEESAPNGVPVTESRLKRLALRRRSDVAAYFGDKFADEFARRPVEVYRALPDDRKCVVANMQIDNHSGTGGNT